MADFGIRVSKDGIDASTPPTDATKKNFTFVSTDKSPVVYYSGFSEEPTPGAGASYTHNLGKIPIFFIFSVDSTTSPTYYGAETGYSTTTAIYSEAAKIYIIILNDGT